MQISHLLTTLATTCAFCAPQWQPPTKEARAIEEVAFTEAAFTAAFETDSEAMALVTRRCFRSGRRTWWCKMEGYNPGFEDGTLNVEACRFTVVVKTRGKRHIEATVPTWSWYYGNCRIKHYRAPDEKYTRGRP